MDGISLVPVLRGEESKIREWLHFEHATVLQQEPGVPRTDRRPHEVHLATSRRTEQLFDLDADPREEHDLSGKSDHRVQLERWRSRMIAQLADRPEGFSDGQQLIAGRPYPPLNSGMPLRDVSPGQ